MSVAGGGGGRPLSHRVSFLFRRSEGAGVSWPAFVSSQSGSIMRQSVEVHHQQHAPPQCPLQHCAGVNALAISADEQQLWTGSRDSIVAWWVAGLWGDQEQ